MDAVPHPVIPVFRHILRPVIYIPFFCHFPQLVFVYHLPHFRSCTVSCGLLFFPVVPSSVYVTVDIYFFPYLGIPAEDLLFLHSPFSVICILGPSLLCPVSTVYLFSDHFSLAVVFIFYFQHRRALQVIYLPDLSQLRILIPLPVLQLVIAFQRVQRIIVYIPHTASVRMDLFGHSSQIVIFIPALVSLAVPPFYDPAVPVVVPFFTDDFFSFSFFHHCRLRIIQALIVVVPVPGFFIAPQVCSIIPLFLFHLVFHIWFFIGSFPVLVFCLFSHCPVLFHCLHARRLSIRPQCIFLFYFHSCFPFILPARQQAVPAVICHLYPHIPSAFRAVPFLCRYDIPFSVVTVLPFRYLFQILSAAVIFPFFQLHR